MGGFIGLVIVALSAETLFPGTLTDVDSFRTTVIFFFATFVVGEVIALALSEKISKKGESLAEDLASMKWGNLFGYYNIVTLLISYFFYPTLPISILCMISGLVNIPHIFEGDSTSIALIMFALACLLVFSLVTVAEYKITKWLLKDSDSINGSSFVAAMAFNVPVWILYIIVFFV